MKNHNIFFILLISLCTLSCSSKLEKSKSVKITVLTESKNDSTLQIFKMNMFSLKQITISESQVDSLGTTQFKFNIGSPTFATLAIGGTSYPIYVEMGYDLSVKVKGNSISFDGNGSEVNNYLEQTRLIKNGIENQYDKNIYGLEQSDFFKRIDSLELALSELHKFYIKKETIEDEVETLLEKRNGVVLLSIKQIYGWNHGAQNEFIIPESLLIRSSIPFDSALVKSGMSEYAIILHMHMHQDYFIVSTLNKNSEEIEIIKANAPLKIMSEIKKANYDSAITLLLQAKNLDYWMAAEGLTKSVDSLYSILHKDYIDLPIYSKLEKDYNEWQSISPGQFAPNFTGLTNENEKISLSDLKGKVVYIDVWATWCGPCVKEIPHSIELQKRYKNNNQLVFLNVSTDDNIESWKKKILEEKEWLGNHIIMANKEAQIQFMNSYKIWGIPRYIIIDKSGKIAITKAPRPSSGEKITQILDSLL